jgi:hypothetical protein
VKSAFVYGCRCVFLRDMRYFGYELIERRGNTTHVSLAIAESNCLTWRRFWFKYRNRQILHHLVKLDSRE